METAAMESFQFALFCCCLLSLYVHTNICSDIQKRFHEIVLIFFPKKVSITKANSEAVIALSFKHFIESTFG